ncbi:DoxX family protein [Rubrivirga sp.]|uniref:DoxX family protein n=1 Tax=Rubrivirga sp. TaxID=1885344 RepID=UPI003B52A4C8
MRHCAPVFPALGAVALTGCDGVAVVFPEEGTQALSIAMLAAAFVGAGVLHWIKPRLFEAIVPPSLPAPRVLVLVSGVAEILGGLGLLVPAVRPWAGWGLAALLVAVFPANLYMARESERFRRLAPRWLLLARLPLQLVLIAWVLWASRP